MVPPDTPGLRSKYKFFKNLRNFQTYVVLDKNKQIYRFSAQKALWCLGPLNPLRRACSRILTHSVFNNLIMLTILTNCGFMIKEDPPQWVNDYVE